MWAYFLQGNLVDPGTTNFGVNVAGFVLHSAIHAARPDAKCVIHIHHHACIAVSFSICHFYLFFEIYVGLPFHCSVTVILTVVIFIAAFSDS